MFGWCTGVLRQAGRIQAQYSRIVEDAGEVIAHEEVS